MQAWGAALVEEWSWAKVTTSGAPVSELNGLWRKPWELCLIGRRSAEVPHAIARRVIVAVSDLHSRKPCLKHLFERLLFKREAHVSTFQDDTPVLELFARHAVSGWMSWGDEALKYQWKSAWADAMDVDDPPD